MVMLCSVDCANAELWFEFESAEMACIFLLGRLAHRCQPVSRGPNNVTEIKLL